MNRFKQAVQDAREGIRQAELAALEFSNDLIQAMGLSPEDVRGLQPI